MNLFTHRYAASPGGDGLIREWRWVFEVAQDIIGGKSNRGVWVGYFQEYRRVEDGTPWRPAGYYFYLSLTTDFRWGSDHAYYDGPHCSFSLGFLTFAWSWKWCEKCAGEA